MEKEVKPMVQPGEHVYIRRDDYALIDAEVTLPPRDDLKVGDEFVLYLVVRHIDAD